MPADTMVAEDTALSGDLSDADNEMDQKLPACEDGNMAVSACEAPSPSDGPQEEARDPRKWKWAVAFLCFYGFMGSIKPGEPFITPYLLSPEKNFTRQEVSRDWDVFSYV